MVYFRASKLDVFHHTFTLLKISFIRRMVIGGAI